MNASLLCLWLVASSATPPPITVAVASPLGMEPREAEALVGAALAEVKAAGLGPLRTTAEACPGLTACRPPHADAGEPVATLRVELVRVGPVTRLGLVLVDPSGGERWRSAEVVRQPSSGSGSALLPAGLRAELERLAAPPAAAADPAPSEALPVDAQPAEPAAEAPADAPAPPLVQAPGPSPEAGELSLWPWVMGAGGAGVLVGLVVVGGSTATAWWASHAVLDPTATGKDAIRTAGLSALAAAGVGAAVLLGGAIALASGGLLLVAE